MRRDLSAAAAAAAAVAVAVLAYARGQRNVGRGIGLGFFRGKPFSVREQTLPPFVRAAKADSRGSKRVRRHYREIAPHDSWLMSVTTNELMVSTAAA